MALESWLEIDLESPFSLANIPFGIISTVRNPTPRPATVIGENVLDLMAFSNNGGFQNLTDLSLITTYLNVFSQPTLNAFATLGQAAHRQVRRYIQAVFTKDGPYPNILQDDQNLQKKVLIPLKDVKTHLPMQIGDYTDFYAGKNHAYNVGVLFRGPANALQPNYSHLPVGYHGRSSSVVVSGTPIRRPHGQILPPGSKTPVFSACQKLDIELELAAFVCKENTMGTPIPINHAKEYIFGLVLMNDWSARDIQAWEYVPLGPFLGKSFGTTISPWVVLTDALEPFLTVGLEPGNREDLLEYLRMEKAGNAYDMVLTVDLKSKAGSQKRITTTNAKNLLYSFEQMLTHHSVGGCPMRVGDLLGSGTISGVEPQSRGSLLEQSSNGKEPIKLENGEERMFLEDGDEITIQGLCGYKGSFVGFGECTGTII